MFEEIERIMSKEKTFEFNPDRSFDERCEIVRETPITLEMTYEERLAAQRRRCRTGAHDGGEHLEEDQHERISEENYEGGTI